MLNTTKKAAPTPLTGHLLIREDLEGVWVAVRRNDEEDAVPSWMLAPLAASDTCYRVCVFDSQRGAMSALSDMILQYGAGTITRSYLRVEAIPGYRIPAEVKWSGYEAATQPQGD